MKFFFFLFLVTRTTPRAYRICIQHLYNTLYKYYISYFFHRVFFFFSLRRRDRHLAAVREDDSPDIFGDEVSARSSVARCCRSENARGIRAGNGQYRTLVTVGNRIIAVGNRVIAVGKCVSPGDRSPGSRTTTTACPQSQSRMIRRFLFESSALLFVRLGVLVQRAGFQGSSSPWIFRREYYNGLGDSRNYPGYTHSIFIQKIGSDSS